VVQEEEKRMKLPVVWTSPANVQLAGLHEYIAESNEPAADQQAVILLNATNNLSGFPEMGRPGRRRGTRELVVNGTPYIVAYRIRLTVIEILAVIHGARRWPRRFGE
jgi:plasmid stabilization system protein ParE